MTMKMMKFAGLAALALSVAACSDTGMATRNAPLDTLGMGVEGPQVVTRSYDVKGLQFGTAKKMRVSEGNGYYPFADVVWRGDPMGDRVQQIATIFDTALTRGSADLAGSVPVNVEIELARFHGVTERTRFSAGGVYNMVFMLTVRHAQTGAIIEPPRKIAANLSAPGGSAAVIAEQKGQTEKVRVTDYLTIVLRDELSGQYQTAAAL